uniref:glucuronosyltransferase n=1 Tax=Parastrongyloides trichosuri TaxID=131310 RepID=A0A0N4ZAA6_PARTI
DELTKYIRRKKFDIMISEYFTLCSTMLYPHYGIKRAVFSSAMTNNELMYDYYGLYFPSSYIPTTFVSTYGKMSLYDRLCNFLAYYGEKFYYNNILIPKFESIYKRKNNGSSVSIEKIAKTAAGIFINTYPFIETPGPINTKIHFIGGIAYPELKLLPDEWNGILNLRRYNIIFAFGSIAQSYTMPTSYKKAILEAFGSLSNVTFIWKYERNISTLSIDVPENVIIRKWIPQNELLNDKRINIFITHCGMNSILESTAASKPILCIPLFGDQKRNSGLVYRLGNSEYFDKTELSNSIKFRSILLKMLTNDRYQRRANRIGRLIKDAPYTPKEIVSKFIEYIGKNGNINELNLAGAHMSTIEFFNLDIISLIILIISLLTYLFFYLTRLSFIYLFGTKYKKD